MPIRSHIVPKTYLNSYMLPYPFNTSYGDPLFNKSSCYVLKWNGPWYITEKNCLPRSITLFTLCIPLLPFLLHYIQWRIFSVTPHIHNEIGRNACTTTQCIQRAKLCLTLSVKYTAQLSTTESYTVYFKAILAARFLRWVMLY